MSREDLKLIGAEAFRAAFNSGKTHADLIKQEPTGIIEDKDSAFCVYDHAAEILSEDRKQKQREAVRKYEANHDRINVLFAKGTRDRIAATGLNVSASYFIQFATEFMLNYMEHTKADFDKMKNDQERIKGGKRFVENWDNYEREMNNGTVKKSMEPTN